MDSSRLTDAVDTISFEQVLKDELTTIAATRAPDDKAVPQGEVYQRAHAMNLAGLAFSGGGIRSAAFNLGFIQGLANHKALHLFDYFSTVSGGGYIGGWLSGLLLRRNKKPTDETAVHLLQQHLATPPDPTAKDGSSGFPAPECHSVRFLRRYSNYLTPRLGMSGDTLALLSTMVRNVVVMQMLLVSLLVAGFAFLTLIASMDWIVSLHPPASLAAVLVPVYAWLDADMHEPGRWLMAPAQVLLLLALFIALWSQSRVKDGFGGKLPNVWVFLALLAALSAGVFIAVGISVASNELVPMTGGIWVVLPALGYCVAWIYVPVRDWRKLPRALLGMSAGAITFALILHYGMAWFSKLLLLAPFGHAVAFAPAVALAIYSLVITVHLAIAGSAVSEQQREWWARAGGQANAICVVWALAFVFLFYVPPLIHYGAAWSVASGSLWSALLWVGTHMAHMDKTNGETGDFWREVPAMLAPWLFLGGLVGMVAWAYAALLPGVRLDGASLGETVAHYQASLNVLDLAMPARITAVAGGLFLFLVMFIDLNLFSAHSFYRNRLARTFLGASRIKRQPNPFTGFDQKDDLGLSELAGQRPIQLINANLNLTGGQELAWQTRRGINFVFTPAYSGYSAQTSTGVLIGGYCPSAHYGGGLSLATVVAVSGAAASPNMGYHTSTAVAALLTAFNLRLARWCPNPVADQCERREPRLWSAGPLFAELFGESRSDNAWVNLSDGGHFENLGLYELVRRRARLIVVTDVGTDGDYQFDDLALAVRKVWVDFGVKITIPPEELDKIRPPKNVPPGDRFCENSFALGRIAYPGEKDQKEGYLVYVKSAITKGAPIDIRQYRDAHPDFPHESTADQWFDEDQFEAYRHLGQCAAAAVCQMWLEGKEDEPATTRVAAIIARLRSAPA